ncbi:hypothetical protein KF840_00150 [bacterium]|nr:hypothetical protein [bacterium]
MAHTRWLRRVRAFTLSLLVAASATAARGVDGVIEINQARAKAGGVTPSDAAKFPVTIDRPGSYRLTSNLDLTDAAARGGGATAQDTTAILVTANDVTIDLNGFSILGATTCVGTPVGSCSPLGSGVGIDATGRQGVAVRNGGIRGMGANGITLGTFGRVDSVRVLHCGGSGIQGSTGVVTNSEGSVNGVDGIADPSVASGCVGNGNKGDGVRGGSILNAFTQANGGNGVVASVAIGCQTGGNGGTDLVAAGAPKMNSCGALPCP